MAREILLIHHSHFDPIWRRCFDRPAHYNGITVRSYAELEERIINAWLDLAADGLTYDEGQVAIWRKYLERNPDKRDALREQVQAGRFNMVLAGETVQDTVMSTAEGLVRNFLVAMPFYRDLVGEDHPGLKQAWLEDAFGNSPNYPQVLRGVGAEVACQISYRQLPEDIWVGIDGTSIPCMDSSFSRGGGPWIYHPPCPACRGAGCDTCDDSGIQIVPYMADRMEPGIKRAIESEDEWAAIICSSEEGIPNRDIIDTVDRYNAKSEGKYTIRYATMADVYERTRKTLEEKEAERDDRPSEDLNPAMPGCMVSRIGLKQRIRAISYKLVCAEALAANTAWQDGTPVAQDPAFSDAWRQVVFCQFHDAITGTHIDSGTAEMNEMLDNAERIADAALPETSPTPAIKVSAVDDAVSETTLGDFTVRYDRKGILAVEKDGSDPWFNTTKSASDFRRPLRVGELTIEADFGDAWAKRWPPSYGIVFDSSLLNLGDYHDSVEAGGDAIRWHGASNSGDPMVDTLTWTTTVQASTDGKALEFRTAVDWDTGSRRLRTVVPVQAEDSTATFEVPFGYIERTYDPEKVIEDEMQVNSQEYGALHWIAKNVSDDAGVAVFNRGLPCHRYHAGVIDVSLVRSPQHHFSANLPIHYGFYDTDGQRDTGQHVFEYAVLPYAGAMNTADLTRRGYEYNRPLPVEPPFEIHGDVVVTAWKPSEDGDGWILRVQETAGVGTTVNLRFNKDREVTITDLIERTQGASQTASEHRFPLHRHGILTLKVL
mgnify:CR=1 FL=1